MKFAGHTPFAAWQEIEQRGLLAVEFMPFVRQQISKSDLLLVLYHPELRGGLIEMGIAYGFGIPVWLAHRTGERVSSSALGCASETIPYNTLEELARILRDRLICYENR